MVSRLLPFATRPALLVLVVLALASASAAQTDRARVLQKGTPETVAMDGALLDRAVHLYRDAVDRDRLRGAVLLVARRGRIVLHEAIGWRHHAYRLPMEPDTLFRMASNTKPVVATAALMLVDEGRLALEEPVARHLEAFDNWRSRTITLTHLLTHTSGFRIAPIFLPFDQPVDERPTLQGAVAKFGGEGPAVEPGTSYSYSNAGYNTIGALIEVASGQPLETFLKHRIYEPLGMTDTLNHEDETRLHRMATVYRGTKDPDGHVAWSQRFTPGDPPDFPVVRASGGMISTAIDYARFLQMYLNGGRYGETRLLESDMVKKATTGHVKTGDRDAYGLGWVVSPEGVFSHAGSDGTTAWVDPGRDLLGVVLTQSPGGDNPVDEFRRLVSQACGPAASSRR